jgi:hypothetical protein
MVFPAVFNLSSLNGQNGFVINGINGGQNQNSAFYGFSSSKAGDVNADGIDDIIIGIPQSNGGGRSYIIYGNINGFSALFDLANLNGQNGFFLSGININDAVGASVAGAGDVNADGIDDIIIGAPEAGQSYVIFGSKYEFPIEINSTWLNGQNGFIIYGINSFDDFGFSVSSAGDVNNDGISDIIIGGVNGNPNIYSGQSYVIFGSKSLFPNQFYLSDLNGVNGFVINFSPDSFGAFVSAAGDINADSIDDILIGAPSANDYAGQIYVIFGSKIPFSPQLNITSLNGNNGFIINGFYNLDLNGVGGSLGAARDINNDGVADIIIGERVSDCSGSCGNDTGDGYVVFGNRNGFISHLDLVDLNGQNGFRIIGTDILVYKDGAIVGGVGDINGDGIDDIVMGVPGANNGGAGQTYVIFGSNDEFPASIDSTWLNGKDGFVINGINTNDMSGWSVSGIGDINGDSIDDMIICTPIANNGTGQAYVIFGQSLSVLDGDLNV